MRQATARARLRLQRATECSAAPRNGIAVEDVQTSRKGCFTDFELPPRKSMCPEEHNRKIYSCGENRGGPEDPEVSLCDLFTFLYEKDLDFYHQFVFFVFCFIPAMSFTNSNGYSIIVSLRSFVSLWIGFSIKNTSRDSDVTARDEALMPRDSLWKSQIHLKSYSQFQWCN